jgi:hypothetical protein
MLLCTVVRNIEMRIPGGVSPPNYHVCFFDHLAFRRSTKSSVDHDYSPQATADDHIPSSEVRG